MESKHGIKAVFLFSQVNRQRLAKLAQWVDQNNIKVNVEKTFSLDEASKALDYQKDVSNLPKMKGGFKNLEEGDMTHIMIMTHMFG
jgi:hypothetical protein